MSGRIYISSAFKNLKYSKCQHNDKWLDNDPHFWNSPPTWGICRTDYRRTCKEGDYIFFVLPKTNSVDKQCIYAYLKVDRIVDHFTAYKILKKKRMGLKNPNGNIIVDAHGNYNKFDLGIHFSRFDEIKKYYVIGDVRHSKLLTEKEIKKLAPSFNGILNGLFCFKSKSNFEIITRKGRILSKSQVVRLLGWISENAN